MYLQKAYYLVLLILFQTVHSVRTCNHGSLYPNLDDCSLFYQCTNGQLVELRCPGGLHFDPNSNVCDFPENVNCEIKTTTTVTIPSTTPTTTISTTISTTQTIPPTTPTIPPTTTTQTTPTIPPTTTTQTTPTIPPASPTIPPTTPTIPPTTPTIPPTPSTTSAPQRCQWEPGQEIQMGNRCNVPNGFFIFQTDGNAVIYDNNNLALWHTHTGGRGHKFVFQTDGNLVMYSNAGAALWHSSTHNRGGNVLIFQQDRNLVIYNSNGAALWHTRTQVL